MPLKVMGCRSASMAPRRLSDSEKQDLVGRYKAGESTAALAEAFVCSPNTVTRTVKSLMPADAYAALKSSRQKGSVTPSPVVVIQAEEHEVDSLRDDESSLALDDADDFDDLARTLLKSSLKPMTTTPLRRLRSLFPFSAWETSVIVP